MKKFYKGVIIGVSVVICFGCQSKILDGEKMDSKTGNEKEVIETVKTPIYVDPKIDLTSEKRGSIIIQFRTKPARIAVLEAKAKGQTLALEKAMKDVEESHMRFQKEIQVLLEKVPYSITGTYKTVYNGVTMELPAYKIKRLLESSEISTIHSNKEIQIDPPILPFEQM
ncbi:protease inhibitor I9 family protein [Peribacillus muralis]|uniref:protease inhibitor I9 family protein n=1 Tax=Peribacillus muralis TaxID=264697 RepID=UPI0009E93F71|nr:protease inhibitor I9 family protein [Peribacillus muralis]